MRLLLSLRLAFAYLCPSKNGIGDDYLKNAWLHREEMGVPLSYMGSKFSVDRSGKIHGCYAYKVREGRS